jgi:copper ion binding protein
MTGKTFDVPNISCNHCVMTIKRELGELEGVARVDADARTKTVTVEWEAPATEDSIKSLLAEINYPVAE